MRTFDSLKREAQRSTAARGHRMRWTRYQGGVGVFAFDQMIGECRTCGKTAVLTPKPQPNEAEIAGEAVAVACTAHGMTRSEQSAMLARWGVKNPNYKEAPCQP